VIISGEVGILKAENQVENGLGSDIGGASEGVVVNDGYSAARLWMEDSDPEKYLFVEVVNRMRKFQLVESEDDATFVFYVSSMNQALLVHQPILSRNELEHIRVWFERIQVLLAKRIRAKGP
jgi:hypothetical protein